ncbi:MAG TPA: tape measure protein [Dysgonomonas sp.]|uniref:tape measure protein n=1 Tax=unclassified Dysgonomonas TaxID=2630389 RepID=UPI0025C0E4F0|nr:MULTISPECIES: tape measure protein [unclassified Dysgonomonas]HML64646.1 tape measure protein [Dysgonomonas sp.]
MTNFYTYTIELRDRLSSALRRAGGSVIDTTRRVRDLRNEVRSLNDTPLAGFANSFKRMFSNIPFANYLTNPLVIAGAVGGRALKLGIDQEMRNASFEVLFKGEANAKKMIDNISAYAAKTPYGKAELSDAAQVMAGFGIVQEKIMPNMKAIGDIAMGDKTKLSSLTLAFSQMSATGKLMGQDLLQMINAGFNPLEQMARTTGKSIGQLKDDMSKGLITSEMVTQAFYDATSAGGLFYGMTDKISNTLGGQLSTFMDNVNELLLNLYNIIQPLLMPYIQGLNLLLTDSTAFFDKLGEKISNLSTTAKVVGGVMLWLAATFTVVKVATMAYAAVTKIITALKSAETLAWIANNLAMWANPITWVVALVIGLIAVIAFLIIKVDGWGEAWQHTVNGCKLIFQLFVDSIKFYFNTMVNGLMLGLNKIKEGWYKFKEAVGIGDSSENQRMLAEISADTERRKKEIADGAKGLVETGKKAADEFKKAGQSLHFNDTSLGDVVGGLKSKLGIAPAGVAGMDGDGSISGGGTGSGTAGGKGKGGASGKTANSIATGGSKTTHITINLGNLVGTMTVTAGNVSEGAQKVRDIVLDELSRALTMAQANV